MAKEAKGKRRRGHTRISARHQVTIPSEVLRESGLQPGDEVQIEVDRAKRIVVTRAIDVEARRKAIIETAGSMTGVYPPGYLDRLRDEWER
jgi:AbrB family looped-hinge helix DNA binding protein